MKQLVYRVEWANGRVRHFIGTGVYDICQKIGRNLIQGDPKSIAPELGWNANDMWHEVEVTL